MVVAELLGGPSNVLLEVKRGVIVVLILIDWPVEAFAYEMYNSDNGIEEYSQGSFLG